MPRPPYPAFNIGLKTKWVPHPILIGKLPKLHVSAPTEKTFSVKFRVMAKPKFVFEKLLTQLTRRVEKFPPPAVVFGNNRIRPTDSPSIVLVRTGGIRLAPLTATVFLNFMDISTPDASLHSLDALALNPLTMLPDSMSISNSLTFFSLTAFNSSFSMRPVLLTSILHFVDDSIISVQDFSKAVPCRLSDASALPSVSGSSQSSYSHFSELTVSVPTASAIDPLHFSNLSFKHGLLGFHFQVRGGLVLR